MRGFVADSGFRVREKGFFVCCCVCVWGGVVMLDVALLKAGFGLGVGGEGIHHHGVIAAAAA